MEQPNTYTQQKQAADYKRLRAQIYSFLNRATAEEKHLLRDVLDEWAGISDPSNHARVALAEAFGQVIEHRVGKTYVCVEENQLEIVESFLRFEAGFGPDTENGA